MTKYGRQLSKAVRDAWGTSELKQWHYDAISRLPDSEMRSVAEPAYLMSVSPAFWIQVSGTLQRVNSSVETPASENDTAWVFDCRPTNTILNVFREVIQSEILLSIYKRNLKDYYKVEKGDVVNEKVVTHFGEMLDADVWSVMPITEPGITIANDGNTMFWTSDENANHCEAAKPVEIDEDTKEALRDLVTTVWNRAVSKRRFYTKNAPRLDVDAEVLVQQFPEFTAYQRTGGELNTGFNEKLQNFNSEPGKPVFELTPDMPALSDSNWFGRAIAEGNTMWVHYILTLLKLTMTFEGDSRVAYLSGNQNNKGEVKCRLGHHVSDLAPWVGQDCAYLPQKLSTVVEKRLLAIVLLGMQFSIRSMAYSDVT
ncbi:hypothetical protein SPFM12_00104 [Salmonella phage SPFM12]|nr:hypothetical protein SPFM12_00104 [Salmonella phage SPFM12]